MSSTIRSAGCSRLSSRSLCSYPGQEQPVGFDVFPIGKRLAGDLAAMARQQLLQLLALEPLLPLRRLQTTPRFGILVDDYELSTWLYDAGQLRDCCGNIHGVFQ